MDKVELSASLKDDLSYIFRRDWYLEANPDVKNAGVDPFEHFVQDGIFEDRSPTPLFRPSIYRLLHDIDEELPALIHYLSAEESACLNPDPLFSAEWYRNGAGTKPFATNDLVHYLTNPQSARVDPHPLFSVGWYIERNNIEDLEGLTPLEHYLAFGWRQGFDPNCLFRTERYKKFHRDISENIDPLTHYALWGAGAPEYRFTTHLFDENHYAEQLDNHGDEAEFRGLAHYLGPGSRSEFTPSADPLAQRLCAVLLEQQETARASLQAGSRSNSISINWDVRIRNLRVPKSDQPVVSIVIPTFNHFRDVIRCLESISLAKDSTSLEVVVVDDCSSTEDAQRLAQISNIQLVVLPKNEGFAGATTAGINASRGQFICLLNNDTEVTTGWIDSLVVQAQSDTQVGLVGSKIVRPDLLLQEAGCVVFSDASARQLGSGESPTDWRYAVPREVDYCSGAILLFSRKFWNSVGGFDERFAPAYYEDVDLAFAAKSRGLRVVYEPGSVIFHNEGTTHGRTFTGIKKYQLRNQERFADKWTELLKNQPEPADEWSVTEEFKLRANTRQDRVLIIDHRVPDATKDAGSVRMVNLMKILVEQGRTVHFIPHNGLRSQPESSRLEELGIEVIPGGPGEWSLREYLKQIDDQIHYVLVSRPETTVAFLSLLGGALPEVPVVFDMVDAHAARKRREAAVTGKQSDLDEAKRVARIERLAARAADIVITLSDSDEQEIKKLAETELVTVRLPLIQFPTSIGGDYSTRSGLLFVGGYEHSPNIDAVKYFVREVLPLIKEELGDINVTLAGSNPTKEVFALASPTIAVPGWLDDLSGLYHSARVVIAPLRFGAGIKGKITEAMTFGVPVVSTSIGIDGMNLQPEKDLLIGDMPHEFAAAVCAVYSNSGLWNSLRFQGLESVDAMFGPEVVSQRLRTLSSLLLSRFSGDRR